MCVSVLTKIFILLWYIELFFVYTSLNSVTEFLKKSIRVQGNKQKCKKSCSLIYLEISLLLCMILVRPLSVRVLCLTGILVKGLPPNETTGAFSLGCNCDTLAPRSRHGVRNSNIRFGRVWHRTCSARVFPRSTLISKSYWSRLTFRIETKHREKEIEFPKPIFCP